jgi:oligopeptide transport system permease protein
MINEGWRALRSDPHLMFFPALVLSFTMLAFNFMGDGLRDALDPQMRGTS